MARKPEGERFDNYTTIVIPIDDATLRGRYTDVWARRHGQWRAVAAHVTRK